MIDRDRLARILGMLGSTHPGESLNAGRAAEQMRRESGLTWQQILAVRALPAAPIRDPVERHPERHRYDDRFDVDTALVLCAENPDLLSTWENRFVRSLAQQQRGLSKKQIACLEQIARTVAVTVMGQRRPPPHRRQSRHNRRAAA